MRIIPRSFTECLRQRTPLGVYCILYSMIHSTGGRPSRLRKTKHNQVFEAYDTPTQSGLANARIYMCRRNYKRSFKRGVAHEIHLTARKYGLFHKVPLTSNGVFVDCGANIGELGLWVRQHGMRYIAFEPEPLEAKCNDLNNFNGEQGTMRVALWNSSEKLQFFSKPESEDSSLIDMGDAEKSFEVDAVRLDSVLDESSLGSGVRIFKVEAEGAEPEVLQGASGVLEHFDYVLVDCGPERGVSQENTLVEINNILLKHGFSMFLASTHPNTPRLIAGYKNETRGIPDGNVFADTPVYTSKD